MVIISTFTEVEVAVAYRIFKADRLNTWSYDIFEKSALNNISLVAKKYKTTVGYVLLSSVLDESTIEEITVDINERKKGIGRALIQATFTQALQMQQTVIYLEVRFSNTPAIELYRSMGFELIGQRKNYYEVPREVDHVTYTNNKITPVAPRENAYIMKKVL
ncbi:MAG: ribosomal-protein-alanine N-acetyltransferase [Gammaproteobacteria bacterium]|jgi:ribosomal-protein-alanine N-acetyltransferase